MQNQRASNFRGTAVLSNVILCLTLAGTIIPVAAAQPPAAAAPAGDAPLNQNTTPESYVKDFVYYTRIARYDLAASNGKALLALLAKPIGMAEGDAAMKYEAFVALVDKSGEVERFSDTVIRGQRIPELADVAIRLNKAYDAGKLSQARAAAEITKNIGLLTGTQRQRLLARERLAFAGEYAMPQLLETLMKKTDAAQAVEVQQLMVDMGRQALIPLLVALPKSDGNAQISIAGILAEIPYTTSLPYLFEVRAMTNSPQVKAAVERAIQRIDPTAKPDTKPAQLYITLAESYYSKDDSLTPFPREDVQLLWSYDPSIGLVSNEIATPLYDWAMAMRLTEHALSMDSSSSDAVALWLASNFRREIDTPSGYANPAYPSSRRDATYYAVAAGSELSQRVLGRALERRDTQLALKSIGAVERTTGTTALAGGKPLALVDALHYPNRRVQLESALTLANGQPAAAFEGSSQVVPILASAVREVASKYAIVLSNQKEVADSIATQLKTMGYTVMPVGEKLSDLEEPIASAPGVDLIVTALPANATLSTIAESRGRTKLSATPVLAVTSTASAEAVGFKYDHDALVKISPEGIDPTQMTAAISQLVTSATGGPISGEDAASYQGRALSALRDLSLANNVVFKAQDATVPLVGALGEAKGAVRGKVAEVLSLINDKQAQAALVDAAMAAEGDEMIDLLNKAAVSARRFGNMLDERRVQRLTELAARTAPTTGGTTTDAQATAIAALVGSLSVPNAQLAPLIISK